MTIGFGAPPKRFLSPESAAKAAPCSVLHVIDNDDFGTAPLARPSKKGEVVIVGRSRRSGIFQGLCASCHQEGRVTECWHCGEAFCAQPEKPVRR